MKKFLILSLLAIATTLSVAARDTFSRNISDLPQTAQNILNQNFKAKLSLIKIEKSLGRIDEYEVVLEDGTEINFDRDGKWKDVEVRLGKSVPASIVPKAIRDYVKANNQNKKIIGIEKTGKHYEVELENGVELRFDRAGNFLSYSR